MRGHIFALSLLLLGVVDYAGDDYVTAEVTTDEEIMTMVIPIEFFPCDIGEGMCGMCIWNCSRGVRSFICESLLAHE